MSRYNHFSNKKYEQVSFESIEIGEKFRLDRVDLNTCRRRKDIICVKTDELGFIEQKSRRVTKMHHSDFQVSHFKNKLPPPPLKP